MKNIINGLIIIVLLISCEKENVTVNTFEIEYSVMSGWVDYNYSAHISNNGVLIVTEEFNTYDYFREDNFTLTIKELDLIREQLKALTEIDIINEYGFGVNKPTDQPVTKLSYITNCKTDSTRIYYPDANELPDNLELFLSTIELVVFDNDTLKNY